MTKGNTKNNDITTLQSVGDDEITVSHLVSRKLLGWPS